LTFKNDSVLIKNLKNGLIYMQDENKSAIAISTVPSDTIK